jgi:hypothetical protein
LGNTREIKYNILEGLRALGIPDEDIDSEDVVDLAIDALRRGRDIVNENRGR